MYVVSKLKNCFTVMIFDRIIYFLCLISLTHCIFKTINFSQFLNVVSTGKISGTKPESVYY